MFKSSDFIKPTYKTAEVMKFLNVTYQTIKNYDKSGKLPIKRTETGRRIIFREDLLNYLDSLGLLNKEDLSAKHDVIYARVSSTEQKTKGDLDRQALFLMESCRDLINPIVLKEVGSGLNDKRQKIQELIKMVESNQVNRVFITYRDRLTRFGFHYLESVFNEHGVSIVVVKDVDREKSVQEELVEDMMSLIASFSGKLYGLRSKKNITGDKNDKPK